jgi:hypothetical protein
MMMFTDVIFSTVGGIAYPLLAGWAWILADRGDFANAKRCFWIGAILAAGAMIMFGVSADWSIWQRVLFTGTIGAGLLISATEGSRWVEKQLQTRSVEKKLEMSEKSSPGPAPSIGNIEQHNQSGQNIGQQNNFYPQMPNLASKSDVIIQAGAVVGKVFGGRRSPTNATIYEFTEITNTNQFNARTGFEYDGQLLVIQSVMSRIGLDISRPQDGMIYGGVTAKVVGSAAQ